MSKVDRRPLLAAGAVIIGSIVAYTVEPRAGLIVLILMLGIIIVA